MSDSIPADNPYPKGHPSNPYDEPLHEGHLVKLLAPNHPPVYVTGRNGKGGHYYTSQAEPDPTSPTPGATRFVAFVWPHDVPELLAANPPYRYPEADAPQVADVTTEAAPAPEPETAPAPASRKKAVDAGE